MKHKKLTKTFLFFAGTEMGQGLHTKMISIAAEVLGCNVDRIRISETSTDKVANMSPTAASVSSDLNGGICFCKIHKKNRRTRT
jgi:xanthine dehydrogenase/oxidase